MFSILFIIFVSVISFLLSGLILVIVMNTGWIEVVPRSAWLNYLVFFNKPKSWAVKP